MGNEVYRLNPVIDYAEYKNIDQYSKPVENMVTQVNNQGYSDFNSSGSKVISAVYRPNTTSASVGRLVGMQTNNFVVQAGRYYKLQLLLKLSSGQAPDIDVCTFGFSRIAHWLQMLLTECAPIDAYADNGMLTAIDASFTNIPVGYSEHVWEATAPGHQMGSQASVRLVNTESAEWSLNMNVQEFVF